MVGRVVLRQVGRERLRLAAELVGDELVVVDGVEEGLTDALVVEGRLLAVEHEEADAVAADAVDRDAGVHELVAVGERDVLASDSGAFLKGGHASGVVDADEPLHGVSVCRLCAVVVGVRREVELAAVLAVALAEGPSARPDRRGRHGFLGDFACREHTAQGQALFEQAVAVDRRIGELEGNRGGVLGGHFVDEGEHVLVSCVGLVGLDHGDDVVGGHFGAVGVLGTLAKRDLVLGVGNLRRLAGCEGGFGLAAEVVELIEALEAVLDCGEHEGRACADGVVVGVLVAASSDDGATTLGGAVGLRAVILLFTRSATAAGQRKRGERACGSGAGDEGATSEFHLFHGLPSNFYRSGTAPVRSCAFLLRTSVSHYLRNRLINKGKVEEFAHLVRKL